MRKLSVIAVCGFAFGVLPIAAAQPGTLRWTYEAPGTIYSSPALAPDGTIYIAAGSALVAVTNSPSAASNKWVFAGSVVSSPAIAADGTIYFGDASVNCNLHAVAPDGTEKWALPLQPELQGQIEFESSPAIGPDGTVYFVAGGRLFAVASSGVKKWSYTTDDNMPYPISPVVGRDGTVYVGSVGRYSLYAIAPDGTKKWSLELYGRNASGDSPALGGDGTVYITCGALAAVRPDGTARWQVAPAYLQAYSVSLGKDGTIYAPDGYTRDLYAISPSGEVKWKAFDFPLLAPAYRALPAAPAIDAAGMIYYCASNTVFAIAPDGQVQWSLYTPPGTLYDVDFARNSPVIGPDGTIYAAINTRLYAFAGTNALADSPWPMYRQNPRHTGKVEKPALTPPKKRSDANFELQLFPQQVGLSYTIETSTDLKTWTSLTSFVATAFPVEIADLTATNSPVKYYRAFSSGP